MDAAAREVWNTVEALNRCWTEGDPAGLGEFFHPRMVAITPADAAPLVGGDACRAGWTGYAQGTTILAWHTRDARIEIFGDAAVVSYRYQMVCERDGRRFEPRGRDMMTLVREDDRWWLVGDHFSPEPAAAGDRE